MKFTNHLPRSLGALVVALIVSGTGHKATAASWIAGSATTNGWSEGANWNTTLPPGSGDQAAFDNSTGFTNTQGAINNMVDLNFTINDLSYSALAPNFHSTLIQTGQVLTVSGPGMINNILINSGTANANDQVYATITGGGSLVVSNDQGSIAIRQFGASGSHRATLDLAGLNSFTGVVTNILVAVGNPDTRPVGTLLLAKTNTITTGTDTTRPGILVVRQTTTDGGATGILTLGTRNEIRTEGLIIGGHRANSGATLSFPSGVSNGQLTIRGSSGGSSRTAVIALGDNTATETGYNGGPTSQNTSGTANLTGGAVDVLANDLVVGRNAGTTSTGTGNTGIGTGTLSYEQGTIDVNNLYVGHKINANFGNAVGTVNLNGTAIMTVNTNIQMAFRAANGTANPSATINIAPNAALNVKGDITDTGVGVSALNLSGGTIDMQPAGDATPGNITVDSLTGFGTVTNAGTVAIMTNLALGTPLTAATMNIKGTLVLSNGLANTFTLTNNTTTGGGVNDYLNVIGNVTFNNNPILLAPLSPLATGVYRLVDYTGTKTGSLTFTNTSRYSLMLDQITANQINLVNSGGAPLSLTWKGSASGNWDLTTTNWNNNTDRFFQLDSATFDDTGAATNVNLTTVLYPAAVTVNSGTNYFFTGSGRISGGASLTKSGTGILRVTTPNDFIGPVLISNGILQVGNATALGSTNGSTTVTSGGTLDVSGTSFFSPGELVTIAGNGLNSTGAVINTGAAQQNAIRYLTLSANASVRSDNRFDLRGPGGNGSFSGGLNLNGFTLTKLGPAQMSVVDSIVTNAGTIDIAAGVLSLTRSQIDGPGYINISSNALFIENFTTGYVAKPFSVAGGVLRVVGGALTYGMPITNLSGVTMDIGAVGANPVGLTLTNIILGAGGLTKSNTGTLLLDAANTYAGPTVITAGAVKLGTNGSIANTPSITLFGGTTFDASSVPGGFALASGQKLAGSGGVLGDVTAGSGTGVIPGTSAGTLVFTNQLILNNSSNVFELAADPSIVGNNVNDLVLVTSNLTLGGVSTIKIVPLATLSNTPAYTLFQYTGTLAGNEANLTVSSDSRYNFAVVPTATTPGSIQVSVSGSGTSASLVWQGGALANPTVWDTKVTSNWLNGVSSDVFYLGDNVVLDDSALTNLITLAGNVQPATVVLSNNILNYTIAGSGSLVAGGLNHEGGATLSLSNSGPNTVAAGLTNNAGIVNFANGGGNTFGAGATINSGTLNLFNAGPNAFTQPLSINGGSVVFDQSSDTTLSSIVSDNGSGLGTLEKRGANTLLLSGNNAAFNGLVLVTAGTLRAGNASALGTGTSGTTVASGATFDISGFSLYTNENFTIAGTGVGGVGAMINSGAAQNNAIKSITLSADATVGAQGNRWDVRGIGGSGSFSGALNLGGFTMTKVGAGRISLVDANMTDPGSVEVVAGTLAFTRTSVDGAGHINMGPNLLLLENNSVAVTFTKPLIFNGGTLQVVGNNIAITSPITNLANLTVDNSVALTAGGPITGAGGITKINTGTLTLSETNDYAGGTFISAGNLQIGVNGVTGNLPPQPGGVLTNNGVLIFNRADDVTFNDKITGSGSVQQIAGGTVFLTASNSYAGQTLLNTTAVNSPGGAALRISHPNALGDTVGNTRVVGDAGANGRLEIVGNITVPEPLFLDARQGASLDIPTVLNVSGNNTLTGSITGSTGGSDYNFQSDSGKLTVAGNFVPPSTAGTRRLKLMGAGDGEWSGIISNSANALVVALVAKTGSGTWTLSGTNIYGGSTTIREGTLTLAATGSISNSPTIDVQTGATFNVAAVPGGFVLGTSQTLMGNGSVIGNVIANGTVTPGASIGTLTFVNNLLLAGTTVMEIDRLNVPNADLIAASALTYGGVLTINNIGSPLQAGDTFNLFDATSFSGAFTATNLPALGPSMVWDTSKLAVNGTVKVVAHPGITSIELLGTDVVIGGTNGVPNGDYVVLTSTNVALPVASWTPLVTNQFDGSANFVFTNAVNPSVPERFYLLQVP